MNDPVRNIGNTAQRLARNPIGIIGLFIVLVYGFAALVVGFSASFSPSERLPLIYFLVFFPVLVLGVFTWLVSRHSNALFAPSDFRDEENYIRALMATASLTAAAVKGHESSSLADLQSVVASVQEVSAGERGRGRRLITWSSHVLWVDDHPNNNVNERAAFEAMGVTFTLVLSKSEALSQLTSHSFGVIIADIWLSKHRDPGSAMYTGGPEGPREGYELLKEVRSSDTSTPFYFYTWPSSPEEVRNTLQHGGQGCTDNPQELFRIVMRAILTR